jgi:hypothetical protein
MKHTAIIIMLIAVVLSISCKSTESGRNAPGDHTIKKGGIYHKPGLDNPEDNCVSCHGNDLRSGSSGVSCFSCHGEIW